MKRALLLLLCLMLPACGFSPLYAQKNTAVAGSAAHALDQVYIENIPDREGQYLRNALIDRFYSHGRPVDPRYALTIAPIRENLTDLDITKDSSATRGQLRLDTTLSLVDRQGGQTVLKRKLIAITSYNILQSRFTTRVSEEAAWQNALDDLAGQIERQVALYFNQPVRIDPLIAVTLDGQPDR